MMRPDERHLAGLAEALSSLDLRRLSNWGTQLVQLLSEGGRLLVAGNGGSAAQAQHLTAELIGRYRADRPALSALALPADTSTVTAVGNDYGFDEVFARQVLAHGRPNDILMVLSTSGASPNLRRAVEAAGAVGMTTWAVTGSLPNLLADLCDEYLAVTAKALANIQECQLVAIHLLCAAVDEAMVGARLEAESVKLPSSTATQPEAEPPWQSPSPIDLVVVGDVLLDKDITGDVNRVSPEAPVPVVSSLRYDLQPGGAGLAALMAVRDGHNVLLITALGVDQDAQIVESMLTQAGVAVVNMGTTAATAVKTRVRARGQTLLMLDHASPVHVPGPLPAVGLQAIRSASAVLVSDYGRGVAAAEDIRAALAHVATRLPLVWDPHPNGPPPVPGVGLVTPNSCEAHHFASCSSSAGLEGDVNNARYLRQRWGAREVAVTRGAQGAVLVSDDTSPPLVIPAPGSPHTRDTRGAGDRLAVTVACMLGAGAISSVAIERGVIAASTYATGSGAENRAVKPRSSEGAVALAERVRVDGGTVVATGGCFDLLHRGHVSLLERARQLGDCLIVCLNSDASVARLKGDDRPLVTAEDRAGVLVALSCVDAVIFFDESTPADVLARLRPHIYVKGGDYAIGDISEAVVVERGGGQVVLVPYLDGRSTSSLIEQAARQHGGPVRRP